MIYSKIQGEGIPFIIIHGYFGMSDNWKSFATYFAAKGYEMHLLDMRNHGRSFHSDVFNYDAMVGDVVEYMDAHQLEKAVVLGHSMGGKVAMNFAVKNPERVLKLIVADISPRFYRPHHQTILEGLNSVDFSTKPTRGEVEDVLKNYIDDVSTRMFLLKSLYWKEPGQLAFRFNLPVFNANPDTVGEAIKDDDFFNGETLFLKGGNSDYIKETEYDYIKYHFPLAIIQVIEGVGHWLHAEKPKEFQALVEAFLDK